MLGVFEEIIGKKIVGILLIFAIRIFLIHSILNIQQSEISYVTVVYLGWCQTSTLELFSELDLSSECYDGYVQSQE